MKVSLKWLRDYIDITLQPKELADRLTMAGLEVKAIQTIGDIWDKMVQDGDRRGDSCKSSP